MKKKIIYLTIFLFMAKNDFFAQRVMSNTHYKYLVIKEVMENVAETFGSLSDTPQLIIMQGKSKIVAEYRVDPNPQLLFDEKLYNICTTFGEDSLDAIAFIVGHELTHYFYKHTDWANFGKDKRGDITNENLKLIENQADLVGSFRAFSAGYNCFEIMKTLMERIYKEYKLPNELNGYFTKKERIINIESQADKAKRYSMAFEIANFLTLKLKYPQSTRINKLIAVDLPTKEVLNNIGTNQLLQAITFMNQTEMPFRLPIELEINNRLNPEQMRSEDEKLKMISLLNSAVISFNEAIRIDESYEIAYLNLALAQILLEKYGSAQETIDELAKQGRLSVNGHLIRGIAAIMSQNIEEGESDFQKIKGAFEEDFNRKVFINYQILIRNGDRKQFLKSINMNVPKGETKLKEERNLFSYKIFSKSPIAQIFTGDYVIRTETNYSKYFMKFNILLSDTQYEVIKTNQNNVETELGVKINDKYPKVFNTYGEPTRKIAIHNGQILIYESASMLFQIEKNLVKYIYQYSEKKR